MFPLGLWSNLLRFFDAADTEAENKKEQQIAIRIAEIENTFNFFILSPLIFNMTKAHQN